jgi:hypothetical protein
MRRLRARFIVTSASVALTAVGLALILGCGDDTGLEKRYPVSGMVTYNDKPVEKGQISFLPVDPTKQRPANGTIVDGRYSLTTATPGDGALPGEYRVTIISKEVDDSITLETSKKKGGGPRQKDIARAAAKAKNLVPGKYQLPETSGLKRIVKEVSNTFDFDLTN